jgi:hypothetical protein
MLRSVFAIAVLAACHPTPAPTVVRAAPNAAAEPTLQATPVRQDFDASEAVQAGPLHEVLATGHECRQPPGPIDDQPVTGRPLRITVTPIACGPVADRHRGLGMPWAVSRVEMRPPSR